MKFQISDQAIGLLLIFSIFLLFASCFAANEIFVHNSSIRIGYLCFMILTACVFVGALFEGYTKKWVREELQARGMHSLAADLDLT